MKTCNQCHQEMEYSQKFDIELKGEIKTVYIHFCNRPECPNCGLLQVPVEDLPKEDE